MIKLQSAIPEIIPDPSDTIATINFLTALKLAVQELADKAKSIQMEVRSTVPSTDDVEEAEDVRYESGATRRTYTKLDGDIRYHVET